MIYLLYSNEKSSISVVAARPRAVVTLETEWSEIFTTDHLTLRCEVEGISAEWNYTWYQDKEQTPLDHTENRHTVGFWIGSYQKEYACEGNRTDKPFYSLISEAFTTTKISKLSSLLR